MKLLCGGYCLLATTLLLTNILSSHACSMGEYGMRFLTCWTPYAMELIEGSMAGTRDGFGSAFKRTCGSPLNKAISCHNDVDKKCGYRVVTTDRVKSLVQTICTYYDDLQSIESRTCAYTPRVIDCLASNMYNNDICKLSTGLEDCVKTIFSQCSDGLKSIVNKGMSAGMLDKCVPGSAAINKARQCTAVGSAVASAMCYTPMTAQVINTSYAQLIKADRNAQSTLESFCRGGVLDTALGCHRSVQDDCSVGYVNIDELKALKNSACSNLDDFKTFGDCLRGKGVADIFPCFNKITTKDGASQLCVLKEDFQLCTENIFSDCTAGLQSFVKTGFELATLNCPHAPSGPKCSLTEQASTLAMCWYTSVQLLVPWEDIYNMRRVDYDYAQYLSDFCGKHRSRIDMSIKCHVNADKRCGWETVSGSAMTQLIDTMCGNIMYFTDVIALRSCFTSEKTRTYVGCLVGAKNVDVSGNEGPCRIMTHVKDCTTTLVSGCNPKVKDVFVKVFDIISREIMKCGVVEVEDKTGRGSSVEGVFVTVVLSVVLSALNGKVFRL